MCFLALVSAASFYVCYRTLSTFNVVEVTGFPDRVFLEWPALTKSMKVRKGHVSDPWGRMPSWAIRLENSQECPCHADLRSCGEVEAGRSDEAVLRSAEETLKASRPCAVISQKSSLWAERDWRWRRIKPNCSI
jgi:hypothetical protein